ncbi:MAG: amidohydrolase family protein, partial [SAR324 cluster bacterium]|nr:amidohydrolase family protein [SAR324 cluster bacterium]
FGEDRVIFDGDWPVCLLGAQLNQWVAAYREVLSKRSEIFQKKAMYSNAIQLYQLHGS